MIYHFKFTPYSRPFKTPLKTNHGIWTVRQGILLYLKNEQGQTGWGEIAPLSDFGSETLTEAIQFCQQFPPQITTETIFEIPNRLPACQFGFESVLANLQQPFKPIPALKFCGLLPTGKTALTTWNRLYNQGYLTLKWKIGVQPVQEELSIFKQLIDQIIQTLSSDAEPLLLRLDANGGLTEETAKQWLQICDGLDRVHPVQVEWIEQPLKVNKLQLMLDLSHHYTTSIALDESVASLQQLQDCYHQGWTGIVVIKPAIIGSPQKLREFCQTYPIKPVFSSVFETPIGQKSALQLAGELSTQNHAVGFGVQHWFPEDETLWLNSVKQSLISSESTGKLHRL